MKPLIIYHAQCPDGFGAAYAAWCKYGNEAQYLPASHGSYPRLEELKVDGREVYILDFSFPRATLEQMAARATAVVVLDHHKSAQKDLEGFAGAIFDMNASGARLAWQYFQPTKPIPRLLACIEDRDIWKWRLAETAEALAYVDTLPFDFVEWDRLAQASEAEWEKVIEYGAQMNRKLMSMVRVIADAAEPVCFCGIRGHKVNVGAAGRIVSSEVGEALYDMNRTFAMLWRIEQGLLKVSLRAKQGTIDVSEMAEQYGGGGHAAAAAFTMKLGTPQCAAFVAQYLFDDGEVD
ncbi:phosphoesterase [Paraburkholderia aspalathi]|nr:DHHA1 domain-containing protein [Paraburkholderia aspalathi]MBK3780229.1 phosphoesterase [Paraburkholderia aspalathi]